jgi:hypothetical protein
MKIIIRTVILHIICILLFGIIYYGLAESFYYVNNNNKEKTILDFISLSVTIQSGVGLTYLEPMTFYSKMAVLVQQIILISIHVITLYIFTL